MKQRRQHNEVAKVIRLRRPPSTLEIMPYAVITGVIDMAPVPVVVGYLIGYFRTALFKKIARAYGLNPRKGVISVITLGELSHGFRGAVLSTVRFLSSPWQHFKNLTHFTGLVEETARTYAMAYLFERYLQVTRGKDIGPEEASQIRQAMDQAFARAAQLAVAPFFLVLRQFNPGTLGQLIRSAIGTVSFWRGDRSNTVRLIEKLEKRSGTLFFLATAFSAALKMRGGIFQKTLDREFFGHLRMAG